jgi:hypothetical protein
MVYERINDNSSLSDNNNIVKDKKNPTTFKPSTIKASVAGDHTGVPQE